MLTSFVTTAVRQLYKNASYTLLNVAGLSIGLACFSLVALWVKEQVSYDRFHANADRIFRVANTFTDESGSFQQAVTPLPLANALVDDLPEVEQAVRIDRNDAVVEVGEKQFSEDNILVVDPSFFDIFSFRVKSGDAETALNEPYSVMLSESMARKYFGDENPLGKSLKIFLFDRGGAGAEYKVTGIMRDCPHNSHVRYNFLVSFKTFETYFPEDMDEWLSNGYYTYFLVKPGADTKALEQKLKTFLDKYIGEEMARYRIHWEYFMQPFTDIHLHSKLRYELSATGSINHVIVFGSVGLIVLLLAGINYVNLATAFSTERFREVGVRKVMGAHKRQLIGQHLMESWLLAMVSLPVALVWIELGRPFFESVTGEPIRGLYSLLALGTLVLITSGVGLLAGLYPAFVLSSLNTVSVLKGKLARGSSALLMRKTLVVLQYAVTIVLLVGILVVHFQMRFIREKDLGFNKENLLVLRVNGSRAVMSGYEGFAHEVLAQPDIAHIARSSTSLAGGLGNSGASARTADGEVVNSTVFRMFVDHNFIPAYDIRLLAGRNFMSGVAFDSTKAFIVNRATAQLYGYRDPLDMIGLDFRFNGTDGTIIGVVEDFHYNSLQQQIQPTCMMLTRSSFSRISVRISGNTREMIDVITDAWRRHFPESLLSYTFAEEQLAQQYQAEQRFSRIFMGFSVLSMIIACLGLFALVSFSVDRRTKEIGMRKVLGASTRGIVAMISREFLALILIAGIVGAPVGYYVMRKWLDGFAYRVNLELWMFTLAAGIALLIALLTVSVKSFRAALANPVDALRNE